MKVLMIMAHPDDEVIFGWPIFQDPKIEKHLLICSSDYYNPGRTWCRDRKKALSKICHDHNVSLTCLDYDSSFYKTQTRRPSGVPRTPEGDAQGPFRAMCKEIEHEIKSRQDDFDYIFTHNPYGEYGHMDHKLLFEIVLKVTTRPVLITDMIMSSNWARVYETSPLMRKLYYNKEFKKDLKIDYNILKQVQEEYEKVNSWTWGRETPKTCSLYLIE
jgi:LmbE family N-acetylglucosaminyl deacetylase